MKIEVKLHTPRGLKTVEKERTLEAGEVISTKDIVKEHPGTELAGVSFFHFNEATIYLRTVRS
jgi:hypothetical protein